MLENKVEELIFNFQKLQEERVEVYRYFEEGIKDYLETCPNYDFELYREVVNKVTQDFKRISEEIIAIEKTAREANGIEVADTIAAVQDCEKKKLELTVEHHLSRQMVSDSNEGEFEKNAEQNIRRKLGRVIEEINENLTELRYLQYEG